MSLLTRIGVRAGGRLARTRVGEVLVVHAPEGLTAEARVLAESVPADSEHELVVADLPPSSPVETWKSFLATLPRGRGPLRVVPGQEPREIAPYVGQWLADQTGRTVLAPYGTVNFGAGWLFVHSAGQSGWVSFRRGVAPAWKGKRFPRPPWDSIEVGQVRSAGLRAVAEPLPAGVWLRPDVDAGVLATGRARLTRTLPCLPDAPAIVLGVPDVANIEPADIAAYWRTLPPAIAAAARFVRYGGVTSLDGATLGQSLADALDAEVSCYTGIPSGTPDALDVLALRTDGSLGWSTFARVLAHRPRGAGVGRVVVHRPPVAGLGEVAPGVYWYGPDVVLEVVPAGLWIRPADQLTDPAGVRAAPLDPMHNLLFYEATEPARADRLRELAEGLVSRLDDATRPVTRLVPSTTLPGAGQATRSARPAAPAPPRVPSAVSVSSPTTPVPVMTTSAPAQAQAQAPAPPEPRTAEPEPLEPPSISSLLSPKTRKPDDDTDDTDLPWLSRLMETMVIPAPARPSEVERHDDR